MDRPCIGACLAVLCVLLSSTWAEAGTQSGTGRTGRELSGTPAAVDIAASRPVAAGRFGTGALIHTNRDYTFGGVPKDIQGLAYTLHAHRGPASLSCKVKTDGKLYLLLDGDVSPSRLKLKGAWQKTGMKVSGGKGGPSWTVYARPVRSGDEVAIPSASKWGSVVVAQWIGGLSEHGAAKAAQPASRGPKAVTAPTSRAYDRLRGEIGNRGYWRNRKITEQVFRRDALILGSDKTPVDVILRRTAALLSRIRNLKGAPDLAEEDTLLEVLRVENEDGLPPDRERELFERARLLRRRIAFKNPLITFKDIIFLKHQRAGANHMCDQYHGHKNRKGGGLFVLRNAFGGSPEVENLLAASEVGNGRLKGRTLAGGSFISLDLSYDAKTVLFARVELSGKGFTEGGCFHVFKANADGSGLVQLTDGPWNEFDPCFLPNGRIVFISGRIGGYGRCHGRAVPTFTLHSMRADGSDIIPLSWHDTNEWHPSVDNNGMIIYSRWDYVDRDSDIAHHIWHTFPDGRDPRSFHGNYPDKRELLPWMELSARSIPGSRKYISTAAAHHGQSYGSLVAVDLRESDDRAMSQLKRVTPDVLFPESERGKQAYGSPWPLGEDFYICVYDEKGGNYGIYLVDSFGNRIPLYRDPSIACLDPIPLTPRKRPPVIPSRTTQAAEDRRRGADISMGVVTVLNVYESEFPWPEGTKIKELRIVNIFPKATTNANKPNIGYANQSLARGVLGTVPVEEDGSAHFKVPTGTDIYFQALDGNGMAVQSMRSGTYVHPGETLSCIGCHEPKGTTPRNDAGQMPIAFRRPPSTIKPEVEGSYPLSFARLVQPVLNGKCVVCHAKEKKAPGLRGDKFAGSGWSEAFDTLRRYAWGKHGGNGSIRKNGGSYSIPGKVCANASKLYAHLTRNMMNGGKRRCDVKLTAEEMRRITLWLDCNSNFYGAYFDTAKQAKGLVVKPRFGTPPWVDFDKLVK